MKTLIFYLVLMLLAGIANAQEITELKEARVEFAPFPSEVVKSGDNFLYKVNENFAGEFEKDPLAFMNAHFNIKSLISEMKEGGYTSYFVTFKSQKGTLEADFNQKGELVRSTSKFKNILLPAELRHQIYRDHKGWEMVKNLHVSRGSQGVVNRDYYKIKLENGKERKSIKIDAPRSLGVAAN